MVDMKEYGIPDELLAVDYEKKYDELAIEFSKLNNRLESEKRYSKELHNTIQILKAEIVSINSQKALAEADHIRKWVFNEIIEDLERLRDGIEEDEY